MTIVGIIATFFAVGEAIAGVFIHFHVPDRLKGLFKRKEIFSPGRVLTEVGKLDKKIRRSDFRPDVIIGIGGGRYVGGGIIGNFLASRKFLDFPALHFELPRDAEGNTIWDLCDGVIRAHLTDENICWNNFLLVDDTIRTGETIEGVAERLDTILREKGKENPYIRVAAIVVDPISRQKIGDKLWERIFYCKLSDKKVDLPWFV